MSTKIKSQPIKRKPAAHVVWFEIPADNPARAKSFYSKLFGWSIEPFNGMADLLYIDTAGGNELAPDGGLVARRCPEQRITQYVSVSSVAKFLAKAKKLGGRTCVPRTAIPRMGYFAFCRDTENNVFGLWEADEEAE